MNKILNDKEIEKVYEQILKVQAAEKLSKRIVKIQRDLIKRGVTMRIRQADNTAKDEFLYEKEGGAS